ncbi:Hypothetical protein HVR_LOCUS1271, partial [uncultured virus]
VLLLSDFDFTIIGGEGSVWFIIFGLIFALFVICVMCSLYMEGRKIWNLTGFHYTLIIISVVMFIGLLLFYQYYLTTYTVNNIKRKLNGRQFQTLIYQYGRDSGDIGRQLRVTDDNIFPRHNTKTLQEMWELLMTNTSEKQVKNLVRDIVHGDIHDSIDVYYNLLWYLCIAENPFGTGLSTKEMKLVSSMPISELEQLVEPTYTGSRDRASLLFTVFSGQSVPAIATTITHAVNHPNDNQNGINNENRIGINQENNNQIGLNHENQIRFNRENRFNQEDRYDIVKRYKPNLVYNLTFNQHNIINHNTATYSIHPPHIYLAQQPMSPIENIIANITVDDNNDLIERLGLGFNENLIHMSDEDVFRYIQGELSLYHNVLTRSEDTPPPPNLAVIQREQLSTILSYYTNNELIESYEPRAKWNSRNDLLRIIQEDVLGIPRWSFTHRYCNNDNTMNILTGEQHGETNKDDIEDPTLSFGVHKNYRCYQTSELEGSFRENNGTFMFAVPDWTGLVSEIDPTTAAPLIREFSLDSIKQLLTLLENAPVAYDVSGLITKIKQGLDMLKSARIQTLHLKQQLDTFTDSQKQIVRTYIAWMFMYAMWMRFWKGPGNPWPITKVNVRRERDRANNHRSSPEERDEHVFIQEGLRTSIIETFENDGMLAEWINGLPAVYYDFDTGDAKCATYPIKHTLDQIALGDYCMGFGSDTILKTAYHYIINVFDVKAGADFDEFMNQMFPTLLDLEYRVVTRQLEALTQHDTSKARVLNARIQALHQPLQIQPGFDPSNYQNNTHVD